MTGAAAISRRPRGPVDGWWSRTALRLHLTLVIAFPGCMAAGWFELTRALHGREIAWVYAFEWPLYGVCGIYLWWRLLHAGNVAADPADATDPSVAPSAGVSNDESPVTVDKGLAAWESYLQNLHDIDPPGGPPTRS